MKTSTHILLCWLLMLVSATVLAQSSKWKILTTKNSITDRSECGMAAVGNKLYVIGGDGGETLPVECFDTKTLTWTTGAKAPVLVHHFQAVADGKNVYILEAFSSGGFPDQIPMSNVYSFNTETNRWQQGGVMPAGRRRAGAGAAFYKGKAYLIAGIQHGHASGTTNMFDEYDPATQQWSALPDAPHIRDHCSAAVIGDKLYVVGGRNTSYRDPDNKVTFFSQTVLDVDCYDFLMGKWSTLSAKLPMGSGGGAVVALDGVLYYMGGERATTTEPNAPRKNVYYLNPLSSAGWQTADSLHFGRNGTAAAVVGNAIYVAGGAGGPGGPPPAGNGMNRMPPPGADSMNRPPMQNPPPNNIKQPRTDKMKIEVFRLP